MYMVRLVVVFRLYCVFVVLVSLLEKFSWGEGSPRTSTRSFFAVVSVLDLDFGLFFFFFFF